MFSQKSENAAGTRKCIRPVVSSVRSREERDTKKLSHDSDSRERRNLNPRVRRLAPSAVGDCDESITVTELKRSLFTRNNGLI